eukprot:RCo040471
MCSSSGLHEGLWSTCWGHSCVSASIYTNGCRSLLNVVRAFSVMTIIFGFFAFVFALVLIFRSSRAAIPAILFGVLTVCCSVITWAVYLGFVSQCVIPGVTKGPEIGRARVG